MRWGLFRVLAVIAACVTPYGPESILVTLRVFGLGDALSLIDEWRPQDFATFDGFELCLLAGLGFALLRGLTLPPIRLLVVLGLVHMALTHGRNSEVLGALAPLFVAAPLAPQLGRREPAADHGSYLAPSALLLTLVLAATAVMTQTMTYRPRAAITPAAAVAAVKASGKTHLLNSYDFGGYLIAQGVKPFIDGRTELYGEAFVMRHHRALWLKDVGTFLDLLRDKAIDVTLLKAGTPAIGLLDRMEGWQRVYADDIAVVHVRTAAGDASK